MYRSTEQRIESSQALIESGSDGDSVNGHEVIKSLGYDQLQVPDSHWGFKLQEGRHGAL